MPKKMIMVVDDEYLLSRTVQELLEKEGYNVITASSGAQALATLRKTKVDLVLVDILMPGMSGLELVKAIRANSTLKDLKLAFLSVVNFSQEQMKNIKKLNILDHIQKPFDNEDLIKRVNKMLKERKG
jgi:CheY-like chemotaxis protein